MALKKQFKNELDALFNLRTKWLTNDSFYGKKHPRIKITRKKVNDSIGKMQSILSDALSKRFTNEAFKKFKPKSITYQINGHGAPNKKQNFKDWSQKKIKKTKNFIYVFRGNGYRYIYVGRTTNGQNRPISHFEKRWLSKAKYIDIYPATKRALPKLECLMHHSFKPTQNLNKASKEKWTSKCPVCTVQKHIELEMRAIFKLR